MERKTPLCLKIVQRVGRLKPSTDVLNIPQPSLRGLVLALLLTQDCILGYFQPSLRD
jgi:hypothetical protein